LSSWWRLIVKALIVLLLILLSSLLSQYLGVLPVSKLESSGREVIGFNVCDSSFSDMSCDVMVGAESIIRNCSGVVCISRIIYDDNYSEPPDIIFGRKYFNGGLIEYIDLKGYEVRRTVIVNITTRTEAKLVSVEENLDEFVLRNVCISEFYEGIPTPQLNYLFNKSIKLDLIILSPTKTYCNISGCQYSYHVLTNKSLLSYYMEALDIWRLVLNKFFNYDLISVVRDDINIDFNVFISGDEVVDVEDFLTYIKLWLPSNDDLIVVIEIPKPARVGGEELLAFTYRNFIFLSKRDVSIIAHEIGHVLGLTHPLISEEWLNTVFYESIMLKYSSSNRRRFTLGDFIGLSHILFLLEDGVRREQLTNKLKEVGIDPENMCVILPMVKRVYVAREIPKVLSTIISEGLVVFDVDEYGGLKNINYSLNILNILKVLSSKYVSSY